MHNTELQNVFPQEKSVKFLYTLRNKEINFFLKRDFLDPEIILDISKFILSSSEKAKPTIFGGRQNRMPQNLRYLSLQLIIVRNRFTMNLTFHSSDLVFITF